MDMKRLAIYIFALLMPITASAEERSKKLTFGTEWGYIHTFYNGYHNNFFSQDGWRVNERDQGLCSYSNAEIYLHIGYNLSDNWNLSAYAGYTNICTINHCIPVSLRATRYFKENEKGDRWLTFIDLGSGITARKHPQEILTGKVGTGYRISLSEDTKIDIIASFRMNYAHTDIIYENTGISFEKVNRNNFYAGAASIGISLTF